MRADLGAGRRRGGRLGLFAGLLLGAPALLCLCAAPAGAAQTIAGPGDGAGQVDSPTSVAVDQASGELYVADGNFRIDKFDPDGEFSLAWGFGVADGVTAEPQACGPDASPPRERCFSGFASEGAGAVAPEAVAVDPVSRDLYVADIGRRRVTRFGPTGEFRFMVGKEVNETDGTNICTAADLAEGDECGRGESGAGPGEFASPRSLAVDSAGQVWVGDTDRLVELDPDGSPAPGIALPGAGPTRSLALDSEGNFYLNDSAVNAPPEIRKLEAGTGNELCTLDAGGEPRTVAVDSEDNVYLGDVTDPYRFKSYDGETCEQTSQFGAGQVIGAPGGYNLGTDAIALDESAGKLYSASSDGGELSAVQAFPLPGPGPLIDRQRVKDGTLLPERAVLAAELNPENEETDYRFEYDTSPYAQGEAGHGARVPDPDATLPASFDDTTVEADLTGLGLTPATTYHFRLCASNEAIAPDENCGPDTTFTTPTAVGIEAQWASGVGAFDAVLHAQADPFGVAGEWQVEYGPTAAYGNSAPQPKPGLPAAFGPLHLQVALSGLEPSTTYHYRFVAADKRGEPEVEYIVEGEDRTFTTQPAGLGLRLPDNRAWEMVSPSEKHGGRIGAAFDGEGHVQAAANGQGLAYLTRGSIEADPEGSRAPEDASALARRQAGGQWDSRDLTPPHEDVTESSIGNGREYKLFSTNLATALLEPRDCTRLSPDYSERTPALRLNSEPPAFTPLVSEANVLAGTVFGGNCDNYLSPVNIRGATADLAKVLLSSSVPLVEGAPSGALYLWEAGELTPVSFKPEEEGGELAKARPGSDAGSVRGAISAGGARVFFTAGDGLYLRDLGREETLRLDQVKGGFGVGDAEPVFQAASVDGSVAFFTDTHQLTAEASETGADLYRCEVVIDKGALSCDLTDITGATTKSTEAADAQGLAPGVGEDGSRIYFVARGVLDETANAEGKSAAAGEPNLYLWEAGAEVSFVARLAEEDGPDWGAPGFRAFDLSAAASPSGRYLAFMSRRSLTGYDNRDATSGEAAQEVFVYDAEASAGEGRLACASCNPSGARPRALRPGEDLALEFDIQEIWSGISVAAALSEATKTEGGGISLHRPRAIHDNGRLFFNAADSLVAADSNGDGDVYQYEPHGTGDCDASRSGAGAAQALEGGACVSLISSGTSEGTSAFIDASVGGDDVFFYSPGRLSVTDEDNVTDIYDARVGGVAATLAPRAECQGEACQPAASAPDAPTPASAAFLGPGNLRAAPTRSRCARAARKAKGLSGRAKRMRRVARKAPNRRKSRRMRRKAKRLSRIARKRSAAAKRCRRRARRSENR